MGGSPGRTDLAALPFLRGGAPEVLAGAGRHAQWRDHGPGEMVIDFGDPSDDVFLIAEGALRAVVRTRLGQEAIFTDLRAGDLFGEIAAIDGCPRSANVTTLERTRLCRLPGPVFLDAVLRCPVLCRRLLRLLAARARTQGERLLELSVMGVRQRLVAELLRASRERPGGAPHGSRVISPPPAQHILALRIGARREAVSREMAAMARAGLLAVSRAAIILPDPGALRAELDGPPAPGARAGP